MANHKSSEKRSRQTVRKTERNRKYISKVKTILKSFLAAVAELKSGKLDAAAAETKFQAAQSILGKAASKGLIHRNTAARKIGRLNRALKRKA